MAFRIVWTERASSDLEGIVQWIKSDNPAAAQRFRDAIHKRVDELAQFPRLGAIHVRKRGFEVRQTTYKKYRIIYQVRPRLRQVEVITIRHGARREPHLR